MSVKLMGMVWDRYPEGGGELNLALKLADHAHDDGTHIFPSIATMAEKTRQSRRTVQYQIKRMRESGWLIMVKAPRGGREDAGKPAEYRINPEWIKGANFAPLKSPAATKEKGAEIAPNKSGKGANSASLKLSTDAKEKGAEIAPNNSEKGASGDTKGCNPEQERVQNEAEKGAKLLHPNHQLTFIEPSAAATTREDSDVDNSSAAAAADSKDEEPNPERELTDLLIELEAARGRQLAIDRSRDRVHILTWVGKRVTPQQLRAAHALAVAARERDTDQRATYAGFVAPFVDEVLADVQAAAAPAEAADDEMWWLSDSGIAAQGKRVRVQRRSPQEPTPDYLIRVAQASGRGPWVEYVLKREHGGGRYQSIVAFLEDVLPPDFGV